MATILVVDDDRSITFLLSEVLKKDGHTVKTLSDGKLVEGELQKRDYDLAISDLHMKEVGGIEVLKLVKDKDENAEVLILTGHGSIATAVEAMKLGAFEYLTKPIDMEEFRLKVQKALERRQFKRQIEKQEEEIKANQEMIEKDLMLAEHVQRSLIPQPVNLPTIDVAVKYMPMIGVGGDFADVYYDGQENVYLTLVDVTGHGITAALLVNRICSEIRKLVREQREPHSILYNMNNFIFHAFEGMAMFLTMFSGVINLGKGAFTYSGSAHPAVILWNSRKNKFEKLESQNVILGYDKRTEKKFEQDIVMIGPNDRIVMYTDGIIEAEDANGKQLGIDGFINFFNSTIYLPVDEIIENIMGGVYEYTPNPLKDDVYLIISGMK
ncbi:SpoIIE family protein phosphatase [candidate division KSB1 bacterium]|nr:SpoIIE family protein phosphatase [candidate division KSB1 bacterium]NIR69834.1 SpoIIE family protein phosphatase [candidate division KSB1 bacterium]NIS24381.1 SpoIIE family protein phosphatase [candidate division KSB1 bacterium]NIT71317.1 SpoIIE family protein phosphatase [candidate division KSB1 bacterium]NIU27612.1 SpoIIE family protein phosphatase [candidate division KSB1 bacterium]